MSQRGRTSITLVGMSAGAGHSCGLTTDAIAYCWGANWSGALADGSTTERAGPVRVSGQP